MSSFVKGIGCGSEFRRTVANELSRAYAPVPINVKQSPHDNTR